MHLFVRALAAIGLVLSCQAAFAVDCALSPTTPCGSLQDDAIFHADVTLGVPANSSYPGSVKIANGGASGVFVTILNPSATTAYNFNLPATAGTSSYLLTSAGGSTSPMTWTSPSVTVNGTTCTLGSTCSPAAIASSIAVGTTGVTGGTTAYILYNNGGLLGNVAQVPLAAGGTNASLTASNGGIVWSNASQLQVLSGTVTAGQMLQSGSSVTPAWSTATWPATTTINRILYSSAANTVGEITTGNSSVLVTDGAGVPSLSTAIPAGVTATTNANPGDTTNKVATNAFVQNALLLSMATVPMAIATGTYSFASNATVTPTINHVAVGGAITSATVVSGGSGVAVGDLFIASVGNHDALIRVETVSGSAAATLSVVYGGTGYSTANGVTTEAGSAIPYTYLLSGVLTGNVTIIATNGTYQTASQQWYFANNTTGAHTVTVCVSNGSNACSAGRTAVIPQGTANSRIVGVQTDGELNVDIASIVNAADLTGTTLASGVTGSSLTSVGTIGSGTWNASLIPLAYGGTNANLVASNGGIFYSTGSAGAILAGTATANQMLLSGLSTTPAWSTATWPATAAKGVLLNASAANTIAATVTPVLGDSGHSTGTLGFAGVTSGTATITPQAAAGSPTLTLPNTSGTFAAGASSPLSLDATTGVLSCSTCITTAGGQSIAGLTTVQIAPSGTIPAAATAYTPLGVMVQATSDNAAESGFTPGQNLPTLFNVEYNFGGSNINNGRNGVSSFIKLTSPTSATNAYRFYVANNNYSYTYSTDNGIVSAYAGAIEAVTGQTVLDNGAQYWHAMLGGEFSIAANTGSSVHIKAAAATNDWPTDAVAGDWVDAHIWSSANTGAAGLTQWASIDNTGGAAPLRSTGTIIRTAGSWTVATGLDFNPITISGNVIQWAGGTYYVAGSGNANLAGVTASSLTLPAWTTWNPTIACGSGTITTLGTVVARYQSTGKTVNFSLSIPITTNGTCASYITATLPATSMAATALAAMDIGTFKPLMSWAGASSTTVAIESTAAGYPGGDGTNIVVSGVYERQ